MADSEELISVQDMISPDIITLDLKAVTKLEAINELSALLLENGDISDKSAFVEDVLLRETEGVTGIGQGLAIPHGKSDAVRHTTIAIGVADHDIEWETLDEQPVQVVFLFAVRDKDASDVHLKLLQKVAILLSDDDFVDKLKQVKSKEKLLEMLQ